MVGDLPLLPNNKLLNFKATTSKLLDHHAAGITNRSSQLHRRQVLQGEHAVNSKMPLIVERAKIAEHGGINASNRATNAHRFGHAGRHDVDLVFARDRQADIGRANPGLKQNTGLRRRSNDRADVKAFVNHSNHFWVNINDRHAMFQLAQAIRDGGSNGSRAKDDNVHTGMDFR